MDQTVTRDETQTLNGKVAIGMFWPHVLVSPGFTLMYSIYPLLVRFGCLCSILALS
jgi:hypothetical protein